MREHELKSGVQQFRYIIQKCGMSKYITQDKGAQLWVKVLGGPDRPLPEKLIQSVASLIGKRKHQEERNPEEEKKDGAGSLEQQVQLDGPNYQFEKPFRLYSRLVTTNITTKSTFGTNFANIVLPDEGFYQINLQSTLNSQFFGRNMYREESSLVSNFRAGFAVMGKMDYFHCPDEDTFSVSGVWYRAEKGKYIQSNPLKFQSPQAIDFQIIYLNNSIYVS